MREALVHLAAQYGISDHYYDIWGKQHQVSDESLIALLGAMGVSAVDVGAVEAALKQYETERWHFVLPPVRVVRIAQRPWLIRLNLPAAVDGKTLRWRIEREDGSSLEGELDTAALHSPEQRDSEDARIGREWALDIELPLGYHRLVLHCEAAAECLLAVAPERCFQPTHFEQGGRIWGGALQLYSLRSGRNWGIGDYADLCTAIGQWGAQGGGILGVNPLHALYPHNALHCSPYSPSSRLFKNVLYLAVDRIEDFAECEAAQTAVNVPGFQERLQKLRETELVDYAGVAAHKYVVLELLYAAFRTNHLARDKDSERGRAFREFQRTGGANLRRHALFEALQAHFHRIDMDIWGWPVWPERYRDPDSEAVREFAAQNEERVEFYEYLQWQADLQLRAVRDCARAAGMSVGLYEDLAVSVDRGGAESWSNQELYAVEASVGAPPDDFNLQGQNWGLPPLIPERLYAARYAPFIATLHATMRHAGALRIDHVMGLSRLFWVPPGRTAAHGAYVRYPVDDLFGLLALESQRHSCLVIGEDLGTVPEDMRGRLHEHGVLSYRLLYFERRDGDFKSPQEYPAEALVAASTHDLPTLAGWWEGRDIALRAELNLFPDEATHDAQQAGRAHDRARLLEALAREGVLPAGMSTDPEAVSEMTPALAEAMALYLAASPAKVEVLQLEDVLGAREQANLPGTIDEHPNWRRKLPMQLEDMGGDPRFLHLAQQLNACRA